MISSVLSSVSWQHVSLGAFIGTGIAEIVYAREDRKKNSAAEETTTQKCCSYVEKFFLSLGVISTTYGNAAYAIPISIVGSFYFAQNCGTRTVYKYDDFTKASYANSYKPGFTHYQHLGVISLAGFFLAIGKIYIKGLQGKYQR